MANLYNITPVRTYVNPENAEKAVRKALPNLDAMDVVWSIIWTKEGRCFPVFFGSAAVQASIHFKFNIVAFG